jgi:hypothetical protein
LAADGAAYTHARATGSSKGGYVPTQRVSVRLPFVFQSPDTRTFGGWSRYTGVSSAASEPSKPQPSTQPADDTPSVASDSKKPAESIPQPFADGADESASEDDSLVE